MSSVKQFVLKSACDWQQWIAGVRPSSERQQWWTYRTTAWSCTSTAGTRRTTIRWRTRVWTSSRTALCSRPATTSSRRSSCSPAASRLRAARRPAATATGTSMALSIRPTRSAHSYYVFDYFFFIWKCTLNKLAHILYHYYTYSI